MSVISSTATAYLNFARELRHFLCNTTTLDDAQALIVQQLAIREANFLRVVRVNIFEYPKSPYLPLFKAAGIGPGDVESLVARHGLVGALEALYDAGVYVTFEEIKGRVPIKRGSLEYTVDATDFDNPYIVPSMVSHSGGSTGTPTRTKLDLEHVAQQAKHLMLGYYMYGVLGVPTAVWRGLLPDTSGVRNTLRLAHMGYTMERWFSTTQSAATEMGWYYQALSYLMVILARFHGFRFPFPEYVPLDNPLPIAQWAVDAVQREGVCMVRTSVSKAVRISLAAKEQGLDLNGVTFYGSGEPPTPAKVETIQASGAAYVPQYSFSEGGTVGIACGKPADGNDLHLMTNHLAFIQRPVTVFDQTVNALCLTSLLPTAPKMLFNAQADDYGLVEERACGCLLDQMGLHTHIRHLRSYRKLTSEGLTLVGSDLEYILENVLPSRFGGTALDYQLVEEEDQRGFTKLMLYVDPSVSLEDEQLVTQTLLEAMQESPPSTQVAWAEYRQLDTLAIRRQTPLRTSRDKHFPIRTLSTNR